MISILIDGEELELKDPQITLNLKSPIFNETGSYSYPFKIPNTIRNRRILKFRHRIQSSNNKYEQFPCIVTYKGIQIINGLLNVLIGTADTFEGNIYADSGDFNYYLKDKILQQYPFGEKVFNERGDALGFFNTCRDKFYPEAPFCFPEIVKYKYFENDSTPDELLYYNRYFVNDVYGYELTLSQGSVAHTLLVPFLFMKDVLKTLFTQMGYQLKNELFAHEDFNKLIIYNSVGCNQTMTAFTYDVTHLYYNVHLPFIKVKDFLKSIENNWNARFFPNMFSKEVRIISIDDIIKSKDFIDFSANIRSISTDLDEYNYGTGLSMEGDPDDDYWKEIFDQDDEDDLKVRDPVEKFADLPGYPVDCIDFLRYVKEKDLFYKLDVSNQWIAQEFNSILRLTRLINRANANMIQNGMSSLIPTLDLECICGNKMSKYREIGRAHV